MNYNKEAYSERTVRLFQATFQMAARMGHGFIGSEHILWGLAWEKQGAAAAVLNRHGLDAELLEEYMRQYDQDAASSGNTRVLHFSADAQRVLERAEDILDAELGEGLNEAFGEGFVEGFEDDADEDDYYEDDEDEKIEPEHLLRAILAEEDCAAMRLLTSLDVDAGELAEDLRRAEEDEGSPAQDDGPYKKKGEGKTLAQFSRDLTAQARAGELDPMIGRENEVERVVQILSRRQKNNPVLIGEPGVGKTAVAEGLAQRIVEGSVPRNLLRKRILSLDLGAMLSGTRFRGDFEERIKAFLDEAKEAGDVLLFLDELHTLIGAGSGADGTMDAANLFKPVLGRGELQVIGATTLDEYRRHIEKDAALERRFQPVMVEEPSAEDTLQILLGLRERYEQFHALSITEEALRAAVELGERYIQDRYLPDKAIDLMDEAAARVRSRSMRMPAHLKEMEAQIKAVQKEKKAAAGAQEYERAAALRDEQNALARKLEKKQDAWMREHTAAVDAEDIAAVVSAWTKIPVTMLTQDENERLRNLEEALHARVIGQDEAVSAVAKAIRRGRMGVGEPGRPIGSFLFLGPTGVGKTELCRALAEVMFQDENAMIRLDMSEYMERHTVSKLIGSPPGYVGYDEGGQLTEKVRRKPYSIVLFDEIEKAHPDVWNMLLQVMDDGRLTDAQGRTVNFKNTVIVMTSNIGARDILGKNALGFASAAGQSDTRSVEEIRQRVMEEVKKTFQPEFLNRLDESIVFHQLEREHIRAIARNLTDRLVARMASRDIRLRVEDSAVALLAEKGFEPAYGARPLRRAIQAALETAVAEKMLEEGYSPGDALVATGSGGEIVLKTVKKRARKPVRA